MTRRHVLAALPLLLAVTGCAFGGDGVDDDLPPAHVGQVITDVFSGDVEGRHSYVVLPGRRYDFTVSRPQEEIGALVARDAGVSARAGDDRRFVEVAWELNVPVGDTYVMEAAEGVAPMLTLAADGERYRVGALDEEGVHAAVVVVPESAGDDIGLEIEYDGLTQVIEDAYDAVSTRADGPSSLYLEAPSTRWEYCPETRLRGGDPAVSVFGAGCKANISSPVPYFGPLGWAPAGTQFVVVRFLAGSPDVGYDAAAEYLEYEVDPSEVQLRLEGAGPPELFALEDDERAGVQDDGAWEAQAVFVVDEAAGDPTLSFRRVLVAWPEDPDQAEAVGAPARIRRVHAGQF